MFWNDVVRQHLVEPAFKELHARVRHDRDLARGVKDFPAGVVRPLFGQALKAIEPMQPGIWMPKSSRPITSGTTPEYPEF